MKSIKIKLISAILLCSLLTGIIVGSVSIYRSAQVVKEEAYLRLETMSAEVGNSIESQMNRIEGVLHALNLIVTESVNANQMRDGTEYALNAAYMEDLKPLVLSVARSFSDNLNAYVAFYNKDEDILHTILYTYNPATQQFEDTTYLVDPIIYKSESESMQWYYAPIHTGKPYWSEPYFDETYQIDLFSYTEPIIVDGEAIGVVGVDISFSYFQELIRAISVYDTGYGFLLDADKKIIVHPRFPKGNHASEYLKEEEIQQIGLLKNGVVDYTVEGVSKVMGYHVLDYTGWILGIAPPSSEILKGVNQLTVFLIMLLAIATVLVSGVSYLLGTRVTKPVIKLTQVIDEVSSGNYILEVDHQSLARIDELGVLARAIQTMKNVQKESVTQLKDYATTLEDRVNRRTEELVATNLFLEESLAQNEEQKELLNQSNQQLEASLSTLKETQHQLIETEKIASLNYLMAGVAHELNTPIGNSITLVSYMHRYLEDIHQACTKNEVEKSELLICIEESQTAYETLLRNLSTSRDLIDLFKDLAASKTQSERRLVNFKDMLGYVVTAIELSKSNCEVQFEIDCDAQLSIFCEPEKLSRLFIELIENSFHHGFDCLKVGIITIQVTSNSGQHLNEQDEYSIMYRDNGKGINQAITKDIFTPFFSSRFGSHHKGLGLSMVYNLVKGSFDGDIFVNSEYVEGAEFTIILRSQKDEMNNE